jgi:hypothetical protein
MCGQPGHAGSGVAARCAGDSAIAIDLNARGIAHRMAANGFRCRFVASAIVSAYDA